MEPTEIGVDNDATEQLKLRLETIKNIRAEEAYAGRGPQEVVQALRGLASTALEGVHVNVLHRAPEMRDALERIADKEVVDFDDGTISQYTTTHPMPEHDNAGKPWDIDITHDRPFQTWEDQIENAIDRAHDALNSQAEREEQRQADLKMRGWNSDLSDAVRSLEKDGQEAFIKALNDGAIPERVWTNYKGVSIASFENAQGTYGFAHFGVHRSEKHISQTIREEKGSYFLVPWDGWTDSGAQKNVPVEYARLGNRITIDGPGRHLQAEVEYLEKDGAWSLEISATDGSDFDEENPTQQRFGIRTVQEVQGIAAEHGVPIDDFVAARLNDRQAHQEITRALFQIEKLATDTDTAWLLKEVGISPEDEIKEYDPKLWAEGITSIAEYTLQVVKEPTTASLDTEVKAGYETLQHIKHLEYERLAAEHDGGFSNLTRADFISKSLELVRDVKGGSIRDQIQAMDDAFLGIAAYKHDDRDAEFSLREMREISMVTRPHLDDKAPLYQSPWMFEKRQAFDTMDADLKDWRERPYVRVDRAVRMAEGQLVQKSAPNLNEFEYDEDSYREEEEIVPSPDEKFSNGSAYETAVARMETEGISTYEQEQLEGAEDEDPLEMIRRSFGGAPFSGPPVSDRAAWAALYRVLHGDIPGRPEVDVQNSIMNLINSASADEIEDLRTEEALDITEWRGTGATPKEIAEDLASRNAPTPPEVYRNIPEEGFTREEAIKIGIPVPSEKAEGVSEQSEVAEQQPATDWTEYMEHDPRLLDYDIGDVLTNEREVSGSGHLLNPHGRGIGEEEEETTDTPRHIRGYGY